MSDEDRDRIPPESLRQAEAHQEVVDRDGRHVGTVDHVRGDRILLARKDAAAGGHHHSIPSSWITAVSDVVEISKTVEEAQAVWRDEEGNVAMAGGEREKREGEGPADRELREYNRH